MDPTGPDHGSGDSRRRRTPPELHDVYDEDTVRAIDAWRPRSVPSGTIPVRPDVAGAVLAAALSGSRAALEDDQARDPVVELRPDSGRRPDLAVEVVLVPGDPKASVALVRPWLLPPGVPGPGRCPSWGWPAEGGPTGR